tara:strand:+ start:83 stop:1027 length:945 start_codon:yes stop_codon:yes gene_type:complete
MAKFREFYVQAGAGSNFLAKHCLWDTTWTWGDISKQYDYSEQTNEFHVQRDRTLAEQIKLELNNGWEADELLRERTTEVLPILKSIHDHLVLAEENKWDYPFQSTTHTANREELLNNRLDKLWREDSSPWITAFSQPFYNAVIPEEIKNKLEEAQRYFAQCREYYFKLCEENNWDVDLITHIHPYLSYSPSLTLPYDFKSLAVELDATMDMYMTGLLDIKVHTPKSHYEELIGESCDLFVNRSVVYSDDSVSYRKIFFDKDDKELRKIYEFFDNVDYFEENKTDIRTKFNEYHNNNLKVVKKFAPNLYEQLKTR